MHVIESGTDVATLVLFDPETLPEGFDEDEKHRVELLEQLHTQKRLIRVNTGADGAFLLHAFVDEAVPVELRSYLVEPLTIDEFLIRSGHVYFSGAEYVFRSEASGLRRFPHMGGFFSIPPGNYRVTMYGTEYPTRAVST